MLADAVITPHNGNSNKPYSVPTRKERSRELAQKRRNTYKSLMNDVADVLPFSKEVVSQIDYNSRLRLAMCFIRMKKLLGEEVSDPDDDSMADVNSSEMQLMKSGSTNRRGGGGAGLIQKLMVESLDGFLLTCQSDGTIIHISESIHRHLGLFQSEHIGFSLYDLIHEDDHYEVKGNIARAEAQAIAKLSLDGTVKCSFFCRMKCSKTKLCNSAAKGYKLVYIAGQFKLQDNESYLIGVVHPVSPPSILEVRMEGNMFVTHYSLNMKCTFFDGRLKHLMGFEKEDLVGHVPFEYHHHEDAGANLQCSKGIMERGEGLSGYYRYINKYGVHVWMQSRGIMMFDSRTGKPSYIVCMNYVISKEKGEAELASRQSSAAVTDLTRSFDPFPTPRDDNVVVDPFEPEIETIVAPSATPSLFSEDMTSSLDGSTSPIDSRHTSPDLTQPSDVRITSSDNEDLGYSSSISHSTYYRGSSSVVSPQSVSSSLANDDNGSCYNSVFHGSPLSSHSPDLSTEPLAPPSVVNHAQKPSILAKLLTNSMDERKIQLKSNSSLVNGPVQPSSWGRRDCDQYNSVNGDSMKQFQQQQLLQSELPHSMNAQQDLLNPSSISYQVISYNMSQTHSHVQPQSYTQSYTQPQPHTYTHQPQSHAFTQPPPVTNHHCDIKTLPVLTIEDIQLHTSHY